MLHYEIQFINTYGHIIYSVFVDCKTDKQAIAKAKREKKTTGIIYPDTAWIEILCFETKKRIYA